MSRLLAGTRMSRSFVVTGLFCMILGVPAVAQTRAPAERELWSNESQKPASPPPAAVEPNRAPPPHPAAEPPLPRNDDLDPPSIGCRYRGNKLDLLV